MIHDPVDVILYHALAEVYDQAQLQAGLAQTGEGLDFEQSVVTIRSFAFDDYFVSDKQVYSQRRG